MKIHLFNTCESERRESGRWHARIGFTLVELLVVIAIIGILAALLLPALARSKAMAHRTSCLNRHKQWAKALQMYADDNEDNTPRESFYQSGVIINPWAQVRHVNADNVWYNVLPRQMGERTAAYYAPQAIRGDFFDRAKLFHCPSAKFPDDAIGSPPGPDAYFSIAMNSMLIRTNQTTIKLGAILHSSSTVTFLDNRLSPEPKVHPLQVNDHLGQPSAYASRFVTRHLGRGVMAFADGHAEALPGRDVVDSRGLDICPPVKVIWTDDGSCPPRPPQ
jgi:prepilin-type N-terminal cleavage/methylation domain-containing protein/prepilin-type processing-associated H-X9-DG protein